MSLLLLETGGTDNLLLESGDSLLLEQIDAGPSPNPVRHARSNVCEAGAVYAALVPYELHVAIGGVERGVLINSFQITHTVGQASSATFQAHGFAPIEGQEIRISDDGGTHLLFGGTIANRRKQIQRGQPIIRDCLCVDWTWLMDKQARVFERFEGIGANTAISRILEYCDPALEMRPGSIPEALGNVTVTCIGDTVSAAIGKVAAAVRANWRVRPQKRVDLFQGEAPGDNALMIHDATQVKALAVGGAITQARTRTWYEGEGSTTTAFVEAGSLSIPVLDCTPYRAAGGNLRVDVDTPAYTGVSAASGPGLITGVSGLTRDLPQGTPVYVLAKADDGTAQTTLAGVLGGGLTGVSIHYQADNSRSLAEVEGRADQHNEFFGAGTSDIACIAGHQVPGGRNWEAGRFVDVDLTDDEGETTVGTFRVASVIIRGMGEAFTGAEAYAQRTLTVERHITLRPGARQGVVDVLVGGGI